MFIIVIFFGYIFGVVWFHSIPTLFTVCEYQFSYWYWYLQLFVCHLKALFAVIFRYNCLLSVLDGLNSYCSLIILFVGIVCHAAPLFFFFQRRVLSVVTLVIFFFSTIDILFCSLIGFAGIMSLHQLLKLIVELLNIIW